jgi:hypothetical protein
MPKQDQHPGETLLEQVANSRELDRWTAVVLVAVVVVQGVGLAFGVNLLRSVPLELALSIFGAAAAARAKLIHGKPPRERSIDDLPIPKEIVDEVTAPIDLPPYLPRHHEDSGPSDPDNLAQSKRPTIPPSTDPRTGGEGDV